MTHVAIYIADAKDEKSDEPILFVEAHSSDNGADMDSPANYVAKFLADNWDFLVAEAKRARQAAKAVIDGGGSVPPEDTPAVLTPPGLSLVAADGKSLVH